MNQKKFEIDEAVQFVLEPGSGSELSELEEKDFEKNTGITTSSDWWSWRRNRERGRWRSYY